MSFTLRLEFTGLIMFVKRASGSCVVLMPDCRVQSGITTHIDGSPAVPHAAYLRLDAASLGAPVPPAGKFGPSFEVVHRIFKQEVSLSGLGSEPIANLSTEPFVPSFDPPHFVSRRLRRDLLTDGPTGLLSRLVLMGGAFQPRRGKDTWQVDARQEGGDVQEDTFTSSVVWETTVDADHVTLALRGFETGEVQTLHLRPVPLATSAGTTGVVVKFANLCAHNPLEWSELPKQDVTEDEDFKWLYRLLDHTVPKGDDALNAPKPMLPRPVRVGTTARSDQGCMPGTITA